VRSNFPKSISPAAATDHHFIIALPTAARLKRSGIAGDWCYQVQA